MDNKDRIVKLKHEYDVYRTEYAVAQSNLERLKEDMKKLNVTPDNIGKTVQKLTADIDKMDRVLTKKLDEIDEQLAKNKRSK